MRRKLTVQGPRDVGINQELVVFAFELMIRELKGSELGKKLVEWNLRVNDCSKREGVDGIGPSLEQASLASLSTL